MIEFGNNIENIEQVRDTTGIEFSDDSREVFDNLFSDDFEKVNDEIKEIKIESTGEDAKEVFYDLFNEDNEKKYQNDGLEDVQEGTFNISDILGDEDEQNRDGIREETNFEIGENQEAENKYYSTYEERLKQTPREDGERGEWSEKRGESEFTPNDGEVKGILAQYDKESITYKDAIPDFSEVSESTVEIDNMTDNRADNFRQCDEKCVEQWNKEGRDGRTDWNARDVKEWRQENGYSWHERNDMKTCDLVPTKINDYFGHLGGVAECKKRDMENGGSDFDE